MSEQTETKMINFLNLKVMLPIEMLGDDEESQELNAELLTRLMNVFQAYRTEHGIEVIQTWSAESAPIRLV